MSDLYRTAEWDGANRLRGAGEETRPVLHGHFARFNEWVHIRSRIEGEFLERIEPGAFEAAIEDRMRAGSVRALFNHGHDPTLGQMTIGTITELREEEAGPYYEIELHRSVPPLLIDGLAAGDYGASYRFAPKVLERTASPGKSEHNPRGLPEVRHIEVDVEESGPVTFPADEGATAGLRSVVRSVTDRFGPTFGAGPNPAEGSVGSDPQDVAEEWFVARQQAAADLARLDIQRITK